MSSRGHECTQHVVSLCQIWYTYVKEQRSHCVKFGIPMSKSKDDLAKVHIHGENIILILRPKVKVIQTS